MKGKLLGLLFGAAVLLPAGERRAAAQEVVIDPTQIGVSIENSAQSISEMISMLEQLHINNETISKIWGEGEKILEVAGRFRDAGQLVELTERYNRLLRAAADYAGRIGDWKDEEYFDGYERMMRYITECVTRGQKVFKAYQDFFRYLKTNDRDKMDMIEKASAQIQEGIDDMAAEYEAMDFQIGLGSDIVTLVRFIEDGGGSGDYADTYAGLGDIRPMTSAWISLVRAVVALVLLVLVIPVAVRTGRNREAMDGPAAVPFTRYFSITVIAWAVLEVLNSVIY